MKKRNAVLVFLAGIVVGALVAWTFASPSKPDQYVLTRDIDLEQTYFFSPKSGAPIKGIIRAGSSFEVDYRYSDADYVVFRTVIDRKELMQAAQPQPSTAHPTSASGEPSKK